jgi:hypothetical protein
MARMCENAPRSGKNGLLSECLRRCDIGATKNRRLTLPVPSVSNFFDQYFGTTGVGGVSHSNFQFTPARTTFRVGCAEWSFIGAKASSAGV